MRLDRDTVLRTLRAVLLICLAWELLDTLGYPATNIRVAENIYAPLWHIDTRSTSPIYSSTALLRRCQSSMAYNTSSGVFETGPLSLWLGSEAMFTANPAAGWATWQQLIMQARNPWAVYWAAKFVPESWHIMPRTMRENLELLQAAVPVLTPDTSGGSSSSLDSKDAGGLAGLFDADGLLSPDDGYEYVSRWVAHCSAPVNHTTLKPVDVAYCTVAERGNTTHIEGAFQVQHSWQRIRQQQHSSLAGSTKASKVQQAADAALYAGPMLESLQLAGAWLRQYWPLEYVVRLLSWLWQYAVPTGSLQAVQPLLLQLRVLEIEWEWEVLVVYCIVLLVCFRNWVYLLCVAYKVSRRLALLAFHAPLDRFNGALLTFVGMFLGLWQAMGYAVLDMAVDVALAKLQVYALSQGFTAASWLWYISFEWGLFELRGLMRLCSLAKAAWADIKALVRNPQAIVLAQQPLDKPPPRQVATIGPWPAPLAVPDEVDDLPTADVPRGFICPITQSIMRQPALLLHDATVTPSTYDKEAITHWLSEQSSDPKNPGAKLNMKSVKLVYNGDLARAIEDWVAATLTARRNASQQASLAMLEQRLAQLRMRAQSTLWQQQQQQQPGQQQQQPAPGVQGQFGQQPNEQQQPQPQQGGNPFAGADGAAAAAAAAEGGGAAAGGAASGALHLMRQSSAAIAQVASMDIPSVAAAGLATLADTTRRITTRAAARRLHQQQQLELQQQQGQQPQQAAVAAGDAGGDGGASSNSSDAHTGPSAAASWGFDVDAAGARRRSARVKYRARRSTSSSPE